MREKPLFAVNCCPTTPLQITESSCRTVMALARLNIPINYISMALAGATSPVTLAGTLVCHNAEILAIILLSQFVSKGTPIIYGSSTTMMDLKTTTSPVGCPEFAMLNAGVAALAQFYGVSQLGCGRLGRQQSNGCPGCARSDLFRIDDRVGRDQHHLRTGNARLWNYR